MEPATLTLRDLQLPPSEGVPGGLVRWAEQGEGPTVVLVCGYPGRPEDYRWLVPRLPGYRLILPALPGLGATPVETAPDPTLGGRGRFLAAFLDALDLRGTVVGHSQGAGLCAVTASLRPERVERLALLAPLGLRRHRGLRRSRPELGHALMQATWLAPVTTPLMRWAFGALGFPRGISDDVMRHTLFASAHIDFEELNAAYRALSSDLLIASADDDPLIEPAIVDELAELLPAQRLRWPTGGHGIIKSRAEELAEALRAWVPRDQPPANETS